MGPKPHLLCEEGKIISPIVLQIVNKTPFPSLIYIKSFQSILFVNDFRFVLPCFKSNKRVFCSIREEVGTLLVY